ncbi:extra-large guanine nucleotide-binding protein 1-like [Panicum miliaceum]|uniref:Extra-large guanine nucleotide-binding protein 1-like n=1 Tax=Panicum miliaceum TaxID=4540 RepID=A0A3L6SYA7_PANMI|nr:extra-large guanine nucleotide-binding protein 1-like [Panicum miliaceum]
MVGESSRCRNLESMLQDMQAKPCNLSLELLSGITDDFSDEREIGRGGFGVVYKPGNILLTNEMVPKIADFGLSRLFGEQQSRIYATTMGGSFGYMAPEYLHKGIITKKSDIFSLGVIVIEIITGCRDRPDSTGMSTPDFIENVLEKWRNRLEDSRCTSLEKGCQQIRRCIEMGLNCVQFDETKRPTTKEIINSLKRQDDANLHVINEENLPADQLAGFQCAGQPHFLVNADGTCLLQSSDDEGEYEEEEEDDDDDDDAAAGEARPRAAAGQSSGSLSPAHWRGGRSRGCYRCGKRGGFWGRDKESCLACGARYCAGCVLRAMGSMPEGRKCLDCIGRRVAESRRDALGRGSRVLRRLLSAAEVYLVMRSERECAANQLRAEDVYVNGSMLSPEELVVLQGCPCPPSRLRSGFYWYDKVSGFWGKEGHKPHCIISANLNVGGSLDQKASNGNTGILINGREITKSELQMLKLAGVQCAGKPHFWVNADGTYQEEGQKTVKGEIWDKPIVKLLSPVLSLPTPNKATNQCGEEAVHMVNRAIPDYLKQRTIQKLLLVGSGASTILKQTKFLYKNKPFSVDEREDLKLIIQSNIYNYLGILLEGRERFEDEALADGRRNSQHDPSSSGHCESGFSDEVTEYSLIPRLKAFSDCILKAMALGNLEDIFPAASREYAPVVEELWKDHALQATYKRRSELPFLPPAAKYFLDKAVDISRTEYELSDMDILCADGITSSHGLASTEFSFPQMSLGRQGADEPDPQDTLLRYQLIRINNRGLHENCKWLQMFDDVRLVIFCVAANDYDEYYEDANGTIVNKMIESRQLFESIALHPTFEQMDFLLLLTKFDLLEQKINSSPLTSCDWFDDFTPPISRNLLNGSSKSTRSSQGATLAQMAAHYMATKFKRLFGSLTGRKLYVWYVNALDQESVRSAILYSRGIIKWEEEKPVFGASETVYSEEEV